MYRLTTSLFIAIYFLCAMGLTAQEMPDIKSSEPDSTGIGPDLEIEEESEVIVPSNSGNAFYIATPDFWVDAPAYDAYLFWDTVSIHPYTTDILKLSDTIVLALTDTSHFFVHPIEKCVNSDFGWRKYKYHYGIDLDLVTGDDIYCTFDGVVRTVKKSKSYGNIVVVRHNNGLETYYAHLSKILVKPNQELHAGDVVGKGGSTGRSTGPHLHYEIRYLGAAINPHDIIDFEGFTLKTDTLVLTNCSFEYLIDVQKARYHTIRKGDTLGKIANRYGVSVNYLCKLNGITRKTILRIGRRIRYT